MLEQAHRIENFRLGNVTYETHDLCNADGKPAFAEHDWMFREVVDKNGD